MAESEGQRARNILESWKFNGMIWRGKTRDDMTNQECVDCLRYIAETAGIHYVRLFDDYGN